MSCKQVFLNLKALRPAWLMAAGLLACPAAAEAAPLEPPAAQPPIIQKKISRLVRQSRLKKSSLGIALMEAGLDQAKRPVYQLNASRLFVPASLAKIAALSALFDYFPPWFQFQSALLSSAPVSEGRLKGDLVFRGGGDPGFTSESLWNLVNAFTRAGISGIEGDLLIDDTLYEGLPPPAPSDRSYSAPISAASFNWNSVTFRIRPGKAPGARARVFSDPENSYIKIRSHVKTKKSGKPRITAKRLSASPKGEVFQLSGSIPITETEVSEYRNIRHPAFWLGSHVTAFLKRRGIHLAGAVKKGRCAARCRTLAEWKSRPFAFHAQSMMKFSNNFAIRMLTAHIPLAAGAAKGNPAKGIQKISQHLREKAMLKGHRLIEPSGLSRKNRLSPNHILSLLTGEPARFYSHEILASYPLAGGAGTLKSLSAGCALEGRGGGAIKAPGRAPSRPVFVRAKTGSIAGVLGLAGYARGPGGRDYVFVFLFNGRAEAQGRAQALFHGMLSLLLNQEIQTASPAGCAAKA